MASSSPASAAPPSTHASTLTFVRVLWRSLVFHRRIHLGVLVGCSLGAGILIGALAVGDSVRETLLQRAQLRLGTAEYVLHQPDRFLGSSRSGQGPGQAKGEALLLPAAVARQDGGARVNRIQLLGVREGFFDFAPESASVSMDPDSVWLNEALARRLNARIGDAVVIRVHKPSALSLDAVITPRDDQSVALRRRVAGILTPEQYGDFSLTADQAVALNAFVDWATLSRVTGQEGRVNLRLESAGKDISALQQSLREGLVLKDLELSLVPGSIASNPSTDPDPDPESGSVQANSDNLTPSHPRSWIGLASRRIFLDPAMERAADAVSWDFFESEGGARPTAVPILTYLVNGIAKGDLFTPYSMVTAAGPPYTPEDLAEDEIVVNQWLADDLKLQPGDSVEVSYYRVDSGSALEEFTRTFRVRSVVPMTGLYADRDLMPEFPGLARAESTHDWDAGFELVHEIRPKDEAYWKDYRGTPKAFIHPKAGDTLWSNKFGRLTGIRWMLPPDPEGSDDADTANEEMAALGVSGLEVELLKHLDPADLGWRFQPAAARAAAAATQGQDFGGLFLGFSFFLIVSALLLTTLLFQFGLEQRAGELGVLLALGWPVRRVRRLFLGEGLLLAVVGAVLGGCGGLFYGRAVIWGLNTIWTDAVAGTELVYAMNVSTWLLGGGLSIVLAMGTLWLGIRRAVHRPARELLNEGLQESIGPVTGSVGARRLKLPGILQKRLGWLCLAAAAVWILLAWLGGDGPDPATFFGAGALLLVGTLWTWWQGLRRSRSSAIPHSGLRNVRSRSALVWCAPARQPRRSVAVVGLLASATFLILAVATNRLDASRDAAERSGGTGGFALWAETTLPVVQDLNTSRGREFFGIDTSEAQSVQVVPLRVRQGDDASCLNLNRAQQPRLLGVDPEALATREAFTFVQVARGLDRSQGWRLLDSEFGPGDAAESSVRVVPAIGDANTVRWALGKRVGDVLPYEDSQGNPFHVRIVATVANSILQGNLIIPESAFSTLFPGEAGHRLFLVDVTTDEEVSDAEAVESVESVESVNAAWARALQDLGWEAQRTVDRLNQFNAVQNTYLNTFQMLGGLGLLLGSVGLGVVVLRNVHERRGELAVLQAVGFRRALVRRLVLREHILLLALGVGVGLVGASVPLIPVWMGGQQGFPWQTSAWTLGIILVNGWLWTVWAARKACSGELMAALRGE